MTGFIIDDEEAAAAAVNRLHEISRARVRAAFEERFTSRRMAADYVKIYQKLTQAPRSRIHRALNGWSRGNGHRIAAVPSPVTGEP